MNVQEEIINEIRQLCKGSELLPLQGIHFVYGDKHMIYRPSRYSPWMTFTLTTQNIM